MMMVSQKVDFAYSVMMINEEPMTNDQQVMTRG
jgi:hypothetical protein